jgi:hypothetical protein
MLWPAWLHGHAVAEAFCKQLAVQEIIWVEDESAAVQVYVLNPCALPIPAQPSKQLILSLCSRHCAVTAAGAHPSGDKAHAAVAKPYQVQVPAKLNIMHRGFEKYRANACTSLKLRPQRAGVEELLVRRAILSCLSLPCATNPPACVLVQPRD